MKIAIIGLLIFGLMSLSAGLLINTRSPPGGDQTGLPLMLTWAGFALLAWDCVLVVGWTIWHFAFGS